VLACLRDGGKLFVDATPAPVALPEVVTRKVETLLIALVEGTMASVSTLNEEFTIQQAAVFLNLSRATLVKMMDQGRIAIRKHGKHRWVRATDLYAFQEQLNRDREAAMDELSALGQAALLTVTEESDLGDNTI
jgi:excisionase family DNA binding protein